MNPTKRYLLKFAVIYLVLCVIGLARFKGEEYSEAYLEKYGAEHKQYTKLAADGEFQKFAQRPHLFAANDPRHEQLKFFKEYQERPEYEHERIRIEMFAIYMHLVNGFAFLTLLVHFGRKPMLDFLGQRSSEIGKRVEKISSTRVAAMHARAEAEAEADRWPQVEAGIAGEMDETIAANLAQIREEARLAQIQLARETEDRKRAEQYRAHVQLKEELVTQSIQQLEQSYAHEASERGLRQNVDQFLRLLELIS